MPSPPPEAVAAAEGSSQPASPLDSRAAGGAALRGSVLRGGSYVLTVLLSLISAPLLIRHLGISAFGRYTTVISLVTIFNGLTDAGLMNVAMREWVTLEADSRLSAGRTLLGLRCVLSFVSVAAAVAFAGLAGYGSTLVLGTFIAGVGLSLQVVAHLFTVPLQSRLRFGWASTIDLARQVVAVALIVALVLTGSGLLPFFVALVPAGLLMLAWAMYLARGEMPPLPAWNGGAWWLLLRESIPYAAAVALNIVYFRVTIVVMAAISNSRQTGLFATSFRVTEVLVGVPALAVGSAFPLLAHAAASDEPRFRQATERVLELAVIAGCAMVLGVVLSAPFILQVLAGAAGAAATNVLQIQGLALLPTFIAVAAGYPLLSLRRHRALVVANGSALVANVLLTIVLVPLDQARGAALAAVGAETALAVGQVGLLVRTQRVAPHLGRSLRVLLCAAAAASPLLIPGLHPLLRTAAGLTIYLGALMGARMFPPEVREILVPRTVTAR